MCKSHNFPHFSVLAQQDGQLLYSTVLLAPNPNITAFKVHVQILNSSSVSKWLHLPFRHLKLTKTPSQPSTSGIPGLTGDTKEKYDKDLSERSCWLSVRHLMATDVTAVQMQTNEQNKRTTTAQVFIHRHLGQRAQVYEMMHSNWKDEHPLSQKHEPAPSKMINILLNPHLKEELFLFCLVDLLCLYNVQKGDEYISSLESVGIKIEKLWLNKIVKQSLSVWKSTIMSGGP